MAQKSTVLDWILRILFFFVALISVSLIMLNMVSGTGEPQKQGLEKAFSDSLGVPVSIGTLNKFNAFPQFIIDVSDLESTQNEQTNPVKAKHISIAFSLFDLLQGKKTIQKFDIEGGEFFNPSFSKEHFTNISTKINPPTIENNQALFIATARVDHKDLKISIPMKHQKSGVDFNYSIQQPVNIKAEYASCEIMGKMDGSNKFQWDIPSKPNKDCTTFLALFKP